MGTEIVDGLKKGFGNGFLEVTASLGRKLFLRNKAYGRVIDWAHERLNKALERQ